MLIIINRAMKMNYVIITPAKNEDKYIESTIRSVVKQTILPKEWIIVDDGSTDKTGEIVKKWSLNHPWINLLRKEKSNETFGSNVIQTFYYGLNSLPCSDYEFVVKLDADLEIDSESYFEYQIEQFNNNETLGITSGITYYVKDGEKNIEDHAFFHTTGALKMYRRKCFDQIGGLIPELGWDGIDCYKAMFHGWKTKTYYNLEVNHLGKEKDIFRKRNPEFYLKIGRSSYIRGQSLTFVLLKALKYLLNSRDIAIFQHYLYGYFNSWMKGEKKVVSKEEQIFIRGFQFRRLFYFINNH
jgi:glycosyltransferase involved in cell wall biosynthesis